MNKTQRPSFWLSLLLVVVFVGQSLVVVAMPCQMMETSATSAHDMTAMDHSMMGMHHDMSHMTAPDKASKTDKAPKTDKSPKTSHTHDCCKTMGHCSSSGCSLPAIGSSLFVDALLETKAIADSYSFNLPKPLISSLYRPPISL